MEALVDRVGSRLLRYLVAVTGDPVAAEDALQQTLLDVYRGAPSFRGPSARAWLFTLARNAARRLARRRAGEPERFEPLEELGCAAGWGDDPEAEVMRRHDRALLREALDRLPPTSREILVLRELEDLSGPEAAEVLGIGLAAQKSRLHRARLQLAAAVREVVRGG